MVYSFYTSINLLVYRICSIDRGRTVQQHHLPSSVCPPPLNHQFRVVSFRIAALHDCNASTNDPDNYHIQCYARRRACLGQSAGYAPLLSPPRRHAPIGCGGASAQHHLTELSICGGRRPYWIRLAANGTLILNFPAPRVVQGPAPGGLVDHIETYDMGATSLARVFPVHFVAILRLVCYSLLRHLHALYAHPVFTARSRLVRRQPTPFGLITARKSCPTGDERVGYFETSTPRKISPRSI